MNRNRLLELYATYIWPIARRFVRTSKRCRNCILSERHGPLTQGLCKACSEYHSPQGGSVQVAASDKEVKSSFDHYIKEHIGKRQFDALLMLSGGKDSAYILQRLKAEYPELKILCLFVNNGFSSQSAIESVNFVTEKFKTDVIFSNSRVDEFAEAFRNAFRSLEGRGSYGIVDFTDGEMIFETGAKIAQSLGIPLVIGGLTWVQVQIIVGQNDFRLIRDGQPAVVFPLAVWRTGEQEIRKIVRESNLLPPGNDSPLVSNNSLILAMSAIDVLNLGYCSFEPEFAQLIREGKTDRKTWLYLFELLEFGTTRGFFKKDIEKTLGQLDLQLAELIQEKT